MCNTLNIKALESYCNIKKWNIELDTLFTCKHSCCTKFGQKAANCTKSI